jgi:NAD(P)-dependent dehydrogenase (short-subunit alcohol dehydrogenase family)
MVCALKALLEHDVVLTVVLVLSAFVTEVSLAAAKAETGRPSIIVLKTIIGWPAPNKQNTGKIHGSALGADEVAALVCWLASDECSFSTGATFDISGGRATY